MCGDSRTLDQECFLGDAEKQVLRILCLTPEAEWGQEAVSEHWFPLWGGVALGTFALSQFPAMD